MPKKGQTGQRERFDSSINLNLQFNIIFFEGVYQDRADRTVSLNAPLSQAFLVRTALRRPG